MYDNIIKQMEGLTVEDMKAQLKGLDPTKASAVRAMSNDRIISDKDICSIFEINYVSPEKNSGTTRADYAALLMMQEEEQKKSQPQYQS